MDSLELAVHDVVEVVLEVQLDALGHVDRGHKSRPGSPDFLLKTGIGHSIRLRAPLSTKVQYGVCPRRIIVVVVVCVWWWCMSVVCVCVYGGEWGGMGLGTGSPNNVEVAVQSPASSTGPVELGAFRG